MSDVNDQPSRGPAMPAETGRVRVTPFHRLVPFRRTLLSAAAEETYVWQDRPEEGGGGRVVRLGTGFAANPRPMTLTAGDVGQALLDGQGDAQAVGTLDGLAVDGNDLLLLWRGRVRAPGRPDDPGRFASGLVRWSDVGGSPARLRVEADTQALAAATDLGRSLVLATTGLVRSGPWLWLWARHWDRGVLLRRSSGGFGVGTRVLMPRQLSTHAVPSPGPGGGLIWFKPGDPRVWVCDDAGAVTDEIALHGLPSVAAVTAGEDASVLVVTGDAPRASDGALPALDGVVHPAVLLARTRAGQVSADVHDRDRLVVPPTYPVHVLHPTLAVGVPGGALVYCRTTGDVLRVEVR